MPQDDDALRFVTALEVFDDAVQIVRHLVDGLGRCGAVVAGQRHARPALIPVHLREQVVPRPREGPRVEMLGESGAAVQVEQDRRVAMLGAVQQVVHDALGRHVLGREFFSHGEAP